MRPQSFTKRVLHHKCFPVKFVEFQRTLFLQITTGRLLLIHSNILDLSFALSVIYKCSHDQLSRTSRERLSQEIVFTVKKIRINLKKIRSRVIFRNWTGLDESKCIQQKLSHGGVPQKSVLKYLAKFTRKHLYMIDQARAMNELGVTKQGNLITIHFWNPQTMQITEKSFFSLLLGQQVFSGIFLKRVKDIQLTQYTKFIDIS